MATAAAVESPKLKPLPAPRFKIETLRRAHLSRRGFQTRESELTLPRMLGELDR
jgi:hypothetical protein